MKNGRRFGSAPKPYQPPEQPTGKINVTDLDSRNVKTPRGWVPGYNAQAVCNEHQIVLAAEISVSSADFGLLAPMIAAAENELHSAGINAPPAVVLADAGYWHGDQIDQLMGRGVVILIPPDGAGRQGTRPGWNSGRYAFMRRVLEGKIAGELYRQHQVMIEPVFADTKFNRRIDRFLRRGRAAARSQWRLITASGNMLKLHRSESPAPDPGRRRRHLPERLIRPAPPQRRSAARPRHRVVRHQRPLRPQRSGPSHHRAQHLCATAVRGRARPVVRRENP